MGAKVIEVSTDDISYLVLPGSTGGAGADAEGIEDTVFGQSFQSSESGLINWSISGQALFKGFAGYNATIKKQGTAVSSAGEAMSLVSGKLYRTDLAAHNLWDRSVTAVIYDGAVDKTAEVESIDWLFGEVTFKSTYTVTGAVTADIDYFPLAAVAKGNTFTLTQTADAIETSNLASAAANNGFKNFDPGLRTVAVEISGTLDTAGDFLNELKSRNEFIVEIDPAGTGLSFCRGFFKLIGAPQQGDVGALEEQTLSFALNVPVATAPTITKPFGWHHDGASPIPAAVKLLLDNWESETKIYGRYLPNGAIGQSPLDGIKGLVVLTEVSLNGGVSNMNEFAANMQGDDAFTIV